MLSGIAIAASLAACAPLVSVLAMLIYRGGRRISWEALTANPPAAFGTGGGFGNAIVGTLTMVSLAVVFSVPCGILAASYLALLGPETRFASIVRFAAKVLTGLPSVLAGVFAYAVVVLSTGDSRLRPAAWRWRSDGADGAPDGGGGDPIGAGADEKRLWAWEPQRRSCSFESCCPRRCPAS